MTGFTFSEVFREMATMQQVSLRRLIRLQRGGGGERDGYKVSCLHRDDTDNKQGKSGGECVPSPCGRWLVEEEDSWVVVTIQKVKVFDVDDPFCESAEVDGVTGKDAVVLTAQDKTTNPNHH